MCRGLCLWPFVSLCVADLNTSDLNAACTLCLCVRVFDAEQGEEARDLLGVTPLDESNGWCIFIFIIVNKLFFFCVCVCVWPLR